MKQMTSTVTTKEYTNAYRDIQKAARQGLDEQRAASTPTVGLVSNYDPDQRGFLSPALSGFTMLQVGSGAGTYGTLGTHAEYGKEPVFNNSYSYEVPFEGHYKMRPTPGQPTLIYPAAAHGPAFNTSFIRGGKALPYREYPRHELGGIPFSVIVIRGDVDFVGVLGDSWLSNSPIPPGVRYYEGTGGEVLGLESLPHDLDGRVRVNIKPLPIGKTTVDIAGDDSYWTGTTRDPLNWQDDFWYGYNNNINKVKLAAFLQAHPGCLLS
jgi:hypothetical protein